MNGPITISQLPNTETLSDSDLILCVSGGKTKNISWGQIKALLEGRNREPWIYNTNISDAYVTNLYVTNLTWFTNDVRNTVAPIESVAISIPRISFTAGQWWMISFGVLISIVCLIRIAAEWRWNKS